MKNKTQKKSETKKRFVLVSVVFALILALSAAFVISRILHQSFVVEKKQRELQLLSQKQLEATLTHTQQYFQFTEGEILKALNSPLIVSALERGNEVLSRWDTIKDHVEGVVGVRYFKMGEAALDLKASPPVRFAQLESIKAVERGDAVLPELFRVDGQWLITWVLAINQNPVPGVMVVTLSTEALMNVLQKNNIGKGQITLLQSFGGAKPMQIAQFGKGVFGEKLSASLPQSHLLITFQASKSLSRQVRINTLPLYAAIMLIFVVLGALGVLLGLKLGRKIDQRQGGSGVAIGQITADNKASHTNPLYPAKSILDVDIVDSDESLLGLDDEETLSIEPELLDEKSEELAVPVHAIPEKIFRAYDIRGVVGEDITTDLAYKIGQAVASEALDNHEDTLIVARDARTHSPELSEWMIRGILSTGCHVLNIGTVPTPVLYYATETLEQSKSGVIVTASHNDAPYNGFKVVINGQCRLEKDIMAIRSRIENGHIRSGQGQEERLEIVTDYINTIFSDVALAGNISIVLDAANGVTGTVAPRLFEELGCTVTPLFCDLDGQFPNHGPDPTVVSNLSALIEKVQEVKADLGVAFDGDGDRLMVITPKGKIIWPDRLLMLFAKDIISRNPGADVIFDVKSSRHLSTIVADFGGRSIMWKTGHSLMKCKMKETGALLGGEFSGHIFIKDRWFGFDDGMYAAARLIEIISLQGQDLDELFEEFPETPSTPEIRIPVDDEKKFEIIEKLRQNGQFGDARISTLDGLRADYQQGWGLIRASNTSPNLTMRFEADTEEVLHQLKSIFVKALKSVDPTISVDWNQ